MRAFTIDLAGKRGYDLIVADPEATVQDYLDALEQLTMNDSIYLSRNVGGQCEGCDRCCGERIPLTYIDILRLKRSQYLQKVTGGRVDLRYILDRFCYVVVEGPSVDIMLRTGEDGYCIFLDRKERRCFVYPYRPLVCQSFFCCPSSRKARKLREAIVNQGEDELVRKWLLDAGYHGEDLLIHEACDPKVNPDDWPPNCFTGKRYYWEVRLADLCSPSLWRKLTLLSNQKRLKG
ncbi:YkgJ family cysteine cluster protein [Calderihabitans maritimus]|uniref:YkgJ family cysteine cluster protein n=1 Tax=Calderihabitans maritimus TaxID=1246530 RepID=UPI001EDFB735|nr:YkgJ family cysteine cluster protein [Calderihabitans maritimus]